ncbi:uncharacterized protein LAJ45_10552 [Morchella importuna]|uniref:Uncharacterized protein n=1 Tax=Morchella conica CCBAS932 TaxID=1392247 RepID=A0A3N4KT45_9PEZI|nr:uncharacterized protein LAJ45_10552 [Morchella importuna]KAH8145430.1 hypothetical protein LAJ45_10552 [Morchella importuna]RPB12668.1 hypothetical protein P167DRAFT_522772 [Morchella conica CCBAS932]
MSAIGGAAGKEGLRRGARRDPELYVLFALMCGAFALAGYNFSRNPTMSSSQEPRINMVPDSAPWKDDGLENSDKNNYKYKYHPNADYRKAPKNAPSALHSVILPNVTLSKRLHEKYNKYGKDNY